ncbi:MAG: MBL fold metallo-hydrolase, partial [Proteobacteria bacterium]
MALYTNLDGTVPDQGLGALFKWQVTDRLLGKRRRANVPFATPQRQNDGRGLASSTPHLTWIGHATFVQRLGGLLLATDP